MPLLDARCLLQLQIWPEHSTPDHATVWKWIRFRNRRLWSVVTLSPSQRTSRRRRHNAALAKSPPSLCSNTQMLASQLPLLLLLAAVLSLHAVAVFQCDVTI